MKKLFFDFDILLGSINHNFFRKHYIIPLQLVKYDDITWRLFQSCSGGSISRLYFLD